MVRTTRQIQVRLGEVLSAANHLCCFNVRHRFAVQTTERDESLKNVKYDTHNGPLP